MKTIVTFGTGPHADLCRAAAPSVDRYAARHGYGLVRPDEPVLRQWLRDAEPLFPGWAERPPSWWKLPVLARLFAVGCDPVLWLDADVAVRGDVDDIATHVPPHCVQALVTHDVPQGHVPNCGVWWTRAAMAARIPEMWGMTDLVRHPWWEQAALIRLMGGDPNRSPVRVATDNALSLATTELPYRFNPHVSDRRGAVEPPCFGHATGHPDRLSVIRQWVTER